MKNKIISHSICFAIGVIITLTCCFFYQKNKNTQLNENIITSGDTDKIKITKVKNKKDRIELNIVARDRGIIRTTINKIDFCPKVYKNSLSLIVYGGIQDLQPVLSYGIQYRRQVFSRFHVLTGIKIDTNVNRVNGFQVFVGAGVNL